MDRGRTGQVGGWVRAGFVWAGIVLLAGIAAAAAANLVIRLSRALSRADEATWLVNVLEVTVWCAVAVAVVGLVRRAALAQSGRVAIAVAGGLGLLVLFRLGIAFAVDAAVWGEKEEFIAYAQQILAGQCCFTERSPGYPMLLAAAYAVLGESAMTAELLNAALGVASGIVLYALVRRHLGPSEAIVALYLFALWPAGALISNAPLTETLYILLLLAAAYAALRDRDAWSALAAGTLLALGQYVRPTTIALIPAYMLARLWPGERMRSAMLRSILPAAAATLVVLGPVFAYNLQERGDLSPSTSAFGGWSLYIGLDERSGGRFSERARAEILAMTPGDIWADSDAAGRAAMDKLRADPLLLARLLPTKLNTLWGYEDYGTRYGLERGERATVEGIVPVLTSAIFYAAITASAAASTYMRRKDLDRITVLCIGLVLTLTAVHAFVEVRDRYHAYVTPLLIAVAAAILARGIRRAPATDGARPVHSPP
jgi:4-amino-4-deoxy-L-arabinose transferase-like glycosyltransferase